VKALRSCSAIAIALFTASQGAAQSAGQPAANSGAMVQPTPSALWVERLNDNLTRLSRAPTDIDALIGAGQASYELGDAQAANGFFLRADMVNPDNGRAKLGLALVALKLKQPREAADLFDAAARLGEPGSAYLVERGLAFDLVGQQDRAQQNYGLAHRLTPNNKDLIRNYAISLGISGKLAEAEAMIRPLLYQSDRAAWRDRTMILAMNGRVTEARRIAQTVMPKALADALDPYLQRMGALTPMQKALATHYGQFPADGLRLQPVTSPPTVQMAQKERRNRTSSQRLIARCHPMICNWPPPCRAPTPRRPHRRLRGPPHRHRPLHQPLLQRPWPARPSARSFRPRRPSPPPVSAATMIPMPGCRRTASG